MSQSKGSRVPRAEGLGAPICLNKASETMSLRLEKITLSFKMGAKRAEDVLIPPRISTNYTGGRQESFPETPSTGWQMASLGGLPPPCPGRGGARIPTASTAPAGRTQKFKVPILAMGPPLGLWHPNSPSAAPQSCLGTPRWLWPQWPRYTEPMNAFIFVDFFLSL